MAFDGTYSLGRYAGIPVKLHWTFGLLIISLLFFGVYIGLSTVQLAWFIGYIFTLFLCVVLHEYGHALMARRFNVGTRDIILSPIGGLARLEEIPSKPKYELLIAIAGPLVNLVIAGGLLIAIIILGLGFPEELVEYPSNWQEFIIMVLLMNIVLFVFNLIPAFPMDGGRILRALLALKFDYKRATYIASLIGRILAVMFIVIGAYNYAIVLIFIGMFVFYTATNENAFVRRKSLMSDKKLGDLALENFNYIQETDLISDVVTLSDRTGEKSFLVQDVYGQIIGCLPEVFIEHAKQNELLHQPVNTFLSQKYTQADSKLSVLEGFRMMDKQDLAMLIVTDENDNQAVLDRHMIKLFLKEIG